MKNPTAAMQHLLRGVPALALALTTASFAQETATPDSSRQEEVVVLSPFEVTSSDDSRYYGNNSIGATRTRTDLRDLAMSIQVLTSDLIEDTNANELIDVVTYASGVSEGVPATSGTKDDDDNTGFTLRGVASYLPMRNGFRRLRLAPSANIQQVEILKGPASLLYGQLAPGGTVNYITKRPVASRTFGSITAGFGNYSMKRGVLDYNFAAVPDKLAFRFVGSILDTDAIEDRYHRRVTLMNPTVSWWVTPKTKITLDYEYAERASDAPVGNLPWNDTTYLLDNPGAVDRSFNTRPSGDYIDTMMTTTAVEVVHEFADFLTARVALTEAVWKMDKRVNSTSSQLAANGNIGNRSLQYRKWGSWDTFKVAELVNRFQAGKVTVQNLLGYQDSRLQFRNRYTGANAPGVANPSLRWNINDPSTWILTELTEDDTVMNVGATGNRSTNLNESFYFTNQLTLLDGRLHTLAGIRFEQLTTESFVNNTGVTTVTEAKDAKVPQIGALYRISDNLAVYGSYSESFNPAFSTLRDVNGDYFVPAPETGEGFDLGMKVEIPKAKVSFTAAVFTVDRTNILRSLAPIPDPQDPNSTFNPWRQSGEENSKGFELDLRWRATEKSQLIVSYGYTDAAVTSDEQNPEANEDHDLGNAPKHTTAFFYRQELGGLGFFQNTYFTMGGRAISSRTNGSTWIQTSPGVFEEPPRLPGYALFDFGVGGTVAMGEQTFDLRLSVKNAFDKVYLAHRYAFGDPRMVEFSVRTKF